MSRSENIITRKHGKREQPHLISDRVSRRVTANRLRRELGLPEWEVTTKPEVPQVKQ